MRIYYGWYIVAMAMTMLALVVGSIFLSFGLFVIPVSEEFQLSRADTNTAMIALNIGCAVAAPMVGRILDLYPIRRVIAVSALLFGASMVVLGLSHSLWLSAFVLAAPLAAGMTGAATISASTVVARWFTAYRGRAMAILAVGFSLGGIVVVPLMGALMEAVGWRTTLIIAGCAGSSVILLMTPFIRGRPGPDDIEVSDAKKKAAAQAAAGAVSATPLRIVELLQLPQFWALAFSMAIMSAVMQAVTITLVPLAHGIGVSLTQAAGLVSFFSMFLLIGKVTLATVADRVDRNYLIVALLVVAALGNAALIFSNTYLALAICVAFLALSSGAANPTFYALVADKFGSATFGTAIGTIVTVNAIFGIIAMRFAGEIFDRTGGYEVMFTTFVVFLLGIAALMFVTRKLGRSPEAPPLSSAISG
jgi:MFS family permease